MPTPRENGVAGVIDGKLIVVDGENQGPNLTTVEIYDPALNSWTTGTSIPQGSFSPAAGVIGSQMFVAGGNTGSASVGILREVFTPCSLTLACPADISIGCDVDLLAPVTFSATASDNCDPSPTVTCSPASGSGFPVGTTTVTCTAQDATGNSASCRFHGDASGVGFCRLSLASWRRGRHKWQFCESSAHV